MSQIYARKNFRLEGEVTVDLISQWQKLLHDTALWGGADDLDVFYIEDKKIVGVSIPINTDPMLLLEAGEVLGFVTAEVERSSLRSPQCWISVHDELGNVIESPV
jgi:hypothetical protein